jgi:hypothetical protein
VHQGAGLDGGDPDRSNIDDAADRPTDSTDPRGSMAAVDLLASDVDR